MQTTLCSENGCGREIRAHGLCIRHYKVLWRAGNLPAKITLVDKLKKYSKVNMATGCIEWTAMKSRGYGHVRVNNKMVYAHRAAWQLAFGNIPDNLYVLHRCDNPSCINVEHLFLGSQIDNMADMVAKGRATSTKGSQHVSSKLTEDQVLSIRADPRSRKEIALYYNVAFATVCDIKIGRSWKHVSLSGCHVFENGHTTLTKLTADKVRKIRDDSRPLRTVAADYGITFSHVGAIKRRKLWKHVP